MADPRAGERASPPENTRSVFEPDPPLAYCWGEGEPRRPVFGDSVLNEEPCADEMCHRSPAALLLIIVALCFSSQTACALSLFSPLPPCAQRSRQQRGTRGYNYNGGILRAKKSDGDGDGETATYLIHSHHLLDHKPDNLVLSGRKFKLTGMAVLGRPGVALCVGAPSNADKFLGRLRKAMPQKKLSSSRAGWTSRGSSRSTASSAGRWRNCGRR